MRKLSVDELLDVGVWLLNRISMRLGTQKETVPTTKSDLTADLTKESDATSTKAW